MPLPSLAMPLLSSLGYHPSVRALAGLNATWLNRGVWLRNGKGAEAFPTVLRDAGRAC